MTTTDAKPKAPPSQVRLLLPAKDLARAIGHALEKGDAAVAALAKAGARSSATVRALRQVRALQARGARVRCVARAVRRMATRANVDVRRAELEAEAGT
ncbi:MAG: hypothetical protein NVS3B10_00470 [Polyangiales bacterium]